jgi:hypothetical protein
LRGWGEREGAEWVVREGVGAGGEMTQPLYARMINKKIKIKKICFENVRCFISLGVLDSAPQTF